MVIEQKPFTKYNEKKLLDTFTIRLNKEEREQLDKDKKILQQSKDSTAMKQLCAIGSNVLHTPLIRDTVVVVLNNRRKNRRLGIVDFD